MKEKMTISARINAMNYENLSEEDFAFLVERALKSVRPAAKGPRKPTKQQLENAAIAEKIAAYIEENGPVTCADVMKEFDLSSQRAAAILNRTGKFVKATEAKGKVKATWVVAQSIERREVHTSPLFLSKKIWYNVFLKGR